MAEMAERNKKISWTSLALMSFATVWGFQNLINGFYYFGGLKAVIPWVLIMILYFLPYALMVGELGSTFKDSTAGVSSWVGASLGPKLAFLAGWTYWVVQLPYLSQKPTSSMIALSWAIFQDGRLADMNPIIFQGICLLIFLFAVFVAQQGVSVISKIASIAGGATFTLSILFILMMIAAPAIVPQSINNIEWSFETFIPNLDAQFFTSISILLLAVGGCEMISPYANNMKDKKNGFSKGMIAVAVMVMACAVLGTFALGMMVDSNNIPGDFVTNGAYYAFQQIGVYYFGDLSVLGFQMSNLLLVLYGLAMFTAQFSVLMLAMDAPLRMLLRKENKEFLPKSLFKQNKKGTYVNGYKMVVIIVTILIILPALGIGNVNEVVQYLLKIVSVCLPISFIPVFIAYIAMKRRKEDFPSEYQFVKSKKIGVVIGVWCLALTAIACIMGMYSTSTFELTLNIVIPVILLGIGFIMPTIAARKNKKNIIT